MCVAISNGSAERKRRACRETDREIVRAVVGGDKILNAVTVDIADGHRERR